MAEKTDPDYDALAARLTDPAHELPTPTGVLVGDAASAAGRKLLIQQYGSAEALSTELRSAGRPRLGEKPRGASPSVRGRIPAADRERFDDLIRVTGKKESELVREAVHLLLERHDRAS